MFYPYHLQFDIRYERFTSRQGTFRWFRQLNFHRDPIFNRLRHPLVFSTLRKRLTFLLNRRYDP
jgi:hypothetical protein